MILSDSLNKLFLDRWNEISLVSDEKTFAYKDLYEYSLGLAKFLQSNGCAKGDTIAIKLPNSWEFVIAYFACIIGRYRVIPVNIELNSVEQDYILGRTKPIFTIEHKDVVNSISPLSINSPTFDLENNEIEFVFFTSGTTGKPKGVVHKLDSFVSNVTSFNLALGINNSTKMYHCLPMAYMAGFLNTILSPIVAGGTILVGPRFSPLVALNFWERPIKWGANAIWVTPTIAATLVRLNRNLNAKDKLGKLFSHIFCGTAPLSDELRSLFLSNFGCPLQSSFGMSEVLLVSAQTQKEAKTEFGEGQLLPEIKISQKFNSEFSVDELVIHTPWTLEKYILEHEEVFKHDLNLGMPTGDIGDLEGHSLKINGRIKDLIIRGGVNVSPLAIELVLLKEPSLLDASVIGINHKFWGEEIVACILPNGEFKEDELVLNLKQKCKLALAESQQPDRFVILAELPKNVNGKILKQTLKEIITKELI